MTLLPSSVILEAGRLGPGADSQLALALLHPRVAGEYMFFKTHVCWTP